MKICMTVYDMQECGGLEEYTAVLATNLLQQGHEVSVLSTASVPSDNQYLRRLLDNEVPFVQLPRWISYPASDWPTKERILAETLRLLVPVIYLMACGLWMLRRRSWAESLKSARGWLGGQLGRAIKPDWRKPFARLMLRWWRFWWKPDVLHIHGYTSNLLFVIEWAHDQKLPIVYQEHATPDAQFDWWADFHESINKATRIVAVSTKSAEALRGVCGVTRPIVVRNPPLADPMASGWRKSAATQDDSETIFISTVARLHVTKGLKYLLQAIVQVRATHPKAHFRVYGEGSLRPELLSHARELGLDGEAIFVGPFHHDDLDTIMTETDIFVMSSIIEGHPLALVEAMAYGCPIVATAVGGIPELVQNGVNGLLCNPGDPEGLARNICTLIEDPVLRQRLGRAARDSYAQGPYQPSSVTDHFRSIYQDVLQETHKLAT